MRAIKKLHKWVGLLIGLQVLAWVSSGLVISLLDPDKVSGKQWAVSAVEQSPVLQPGVLLEPDELPADLVSDALSIVLTTRRGQAVYRIQTTGGEVLVDAENGSVIRTNKPEAERLAIRDYGGDGEIVSIQPGRAPGMETRKHTGDYWKVDFSDAISTTLYISASTGEILERRNSYWRVRDFFWMLHIMDYSGREDFNNSLVITVALIAIWLGISGFTLLFGSFNRHDFHFLNFAGKRNTVTVSLKGPAGAAPVELRLRRGSNLFLTLATHDVNLPSICGGGGECGKCRVQMEGENLPAANMVEQGLIPNPLLERGFRLACQQTVHSPVTLRLKEVTGAK